MQEVAKIIRVINQPTKLERRGGIESYTVICDRVVRCNQSNRDSA